MVDVLRSFKRIWHMRLVRQICSYPTSGQSRPKVDYFLDYLSTWFTKRESTNHMTYALRTSNRMWHMRLVRQIRPDLVN